MKIIVIGSFQFPIYAPAIASGFSKLGNEVTIVNEDDFMYNNSIVGNLFNIIHTHYHLGLNVSLFNKRVISEVINRKPNMVFIYRSYDVWPSTIKKIKKEGAIVFTYNNDDPFSKILNNWSHRYYHASIPLAHVNFVYRPKNISDFKNAGADKVELLLPYYLEKDNYYIDASDTIPIAFIGHYEDDGRDKYVKALIDAGLPISVYSNDWKKSLIYSQIKSAFKPSVYSSDYTLTLNQCQIALVFLSKLNSDTYTRRNFEIPATKTLMLSEYSEDLDKLFPENKCAVYFRSIEDLVQKCKYLLENPSKIKFIAENGYKRIKEIGGTEVDRCRQILEVYNSLIV